MARVEHLTSTGWRLVGAAATLLSDTAAAGAPSAGRDVDLLYTARFQMRPRLGGGSAVPAALAILGTAIARTWQDAPPLTPDRAITRPPERFHGLRWDTISDGGAWVGELLWRHPHPVIAGAPCTTHVIVIEQHGHATMTIRVTADGGLASIRGNVGAGQARPAFVGEMNRTLRLTFDGGDGRPREVDDAEVNDFVRHVLLGETRSVPVAVLTPLEDGGFVVSPDEVADELLGLAHLYVLTRHQATFALTDSLGDRRLSCYWGALRAYMPDFSCADRPEDHPLLVRDRVTDPVMRAELVGTLGRFALRRVAMPPGIAERRQAAEAPPAATRAMGASEQLHPTVMPPPPRSQPEDGLQAAGGSTSVGGAAPLLAPLSALLTAFHEQIGQLGATIEKLVEANTALAGEIGRLRTTTAVRAANTSSLERRLDGLERRLFPDESGAGADTAARTDVVQEGDHEESEEPSLVDVVRQAATAHADALLVLDAAERSALESPYADADRLAVILDAMAAVARRRQEGALGTSLRVAFRELAIDYRGGVSASTSEKHRQQYFVHDGKGRVFDCREHIVLGTSYDPRHCLRLYFTSRAPVEPRFVIGHIGRHFDVSTTT